LTIAILALDVAEYRTGWLYAPAGEVVTPRVVKIRHPGEPREDAADRFVRWLDELLADRKPGLLIMEHYLPAGAAQGRTNADAQEAKIMFQSAVRAVAILRGVPVRAPYPARVRKHFIGKSTLAPKRDHPRTNKEAAEDRAAMKAAIIARAQALGYLPRHIFDDDMADAAALHHFASAYFVGAPGPFALFDAHP
jgi:hypothetical protein